MNAPTMPAPIARGPIYIRVAASWHWPSSCRCANARRAHRAVLAMWDRRWPCWGDPMKRERNWRGSCSWRRVVTCPRWTSPPSMPAWAIATARSNGWNAHLPSAPPTLPSCITIRASTHCVTMHDLSRWSNVSRCASARIRDAGSVQKVEHQFKCRSPAASVRDASRVRAFDRDRHPSDHREKPDRVACRER